MSSNILCEEKPLGSPSFLRVDQAAEILERAPRTVRYHLRSRRGFVSADDVYELKTRLELYYKKPFDPGSRRRKAATP